MKDFAITEKGMHLMESGVLLKLCMINKAKKFCEYLDEKNIYYDICIKHKEVKGCEESNKYYQRFQMLLPKNYIICKNLLIHERKGEKRTYLLITDSEKKADLGILKEILNCKKLEFVKEKEMLELLDTTPGNVSLFNIMYDKDCKVNLIIDKDLFKVDSLAFHPLYNGMSIFLNPTECLKFLDEIKRQAQIIEIPSREEKQYVKVKSDKISQSA